jgi:hypothetical protein
VLKELINEENKMSKQNDVAYPSKEDTQTVANFIKEHGIACGGNWAAMIMSAIERGFPEVYAELDDDKEYDFLEVYEILSDNVMRK